MKKEKTFLAIIPARGGSKRLPHKNTLELAGKPLISWSIDAAISNPYVQNVLVSSDDDAILSISKEAGATVLKRPEYLATDTASSNDAIIHAIEHTPKSEYIILLQATSPLRDSQDITNAIELLEEKDADAIISVVPMEHSPLWSNTLEESLSLENFIPDEIVKKRSQDLPPYYRLNGAIYICKTEKFLEEKSFFLKKNIYAYVMNKEHSIDIDEKIDFFLAETLLKHS